jgi:RND family efflux transporter MFP subunit
MGYVTVVVVLLASVCFFLSLSPSPEAQAPLQTAQSSESTTATETPKDSEANDTFARSTEGIETAVVHPFRSANVSAEIFGQISEILFEEGDPVQEGDVVAKIKPDRYETAFKKVTEKAQGIQMAVSISEEELKLKEEVLSFDATSRQDVLKTRQELEVKRQQSKETQEDLRLARMDLDACQVKAPFSGFVAVRYKQPFETVERNEKLFAIVDTSKVYAVANIPESLLPVFRRGAAVSFLHVAGQKYQGTVDRLGKLIDPKSRTTKIYVLIDNADGELEVGTTGSLDLAR